MLKKLIFLMFISTSVFSQVIPPAEPIEPEDEEKEKPVLFEKPKPVWKERLHYGGNISLNYFGALNFDLSPMVGYDISDKNTILGVGATLIYQGGFQEKGNTSYGGRIFLRQAIIKSIFAQAEYELMNSGGINFYNAVSGENNRRWGGSPLIGAGFYQGRQGQKGSYFSVMYNVGAPNYGFKSPLSIGGRNSPFVLRFGYFF